MKTVVPFKPDDERTVAQPHDRFCIAVGAAGQGGAVGGADRHHVGVGHSDKPPVAVIVQLCDEPVSAVRHGNQLSAVRRYLQTGQSAEARVARAQVQTPAVLQLPDLIVLRFVMRQDDLECADVNRLRD